MRSSTSAGPSHASRGGDDAISDRDMVRALRALADPTRFRMVQEIAVAGELSCGAITSRFRVSQPTISHHLKILLDAGLLVKRTEGKHHFASVDRRLLGSIVAALPGRLTKPTTKTTQRAR